MQEATWLTRWEIRRIWPSYLASTLIWVFLGTLAGTVMIDLREGGGIDYTAASIYLLAVSQALTANAGSRDSWVGADTPFSERVAFFRSLPISVGDIVASRVLSRIPVLLLNSAALFVTPYLFSVLVGSGIAEILSPVAYLWFALMWVGYALTTGSWILFGELGLHGRKFISAQYIGAIPFIAAILVAELVFHLEIVQKVAGLAQTHGPLAAGVALVAGLGVAACWAVATSRRLARRDLLA